jgi:anthranilate synthase/aminodeoxychorismate synthase-like glutamine amidotransferase
MHILVIDNYDSFTYNLVHYLEDLNCLVTVKRNDQLTIEEVADYDKIVLSPGPGIPDEAGLLKSIISAYAQTKPILGVCLGHQAIGEVFGGSLTNLDKVYHGIATPVCNFDNMVKMFQEKMAGGSNDPDDLIVRAFKAYEVEGKIEAEMFRHALMNFGDKFNKAEVDDIFGEFEVDDDGFIASKDVIGLFVAGGGEEKKEEAPAPAEEAPAEAPAEEGGDDGGAKKKKKKKKAAK